MKNILLKFAIGIIIFISLLINVIRMPIYIEFSNYIKKEYPSNQLIVGPVHYNFIQRGYYSKIYSLNDEVTSYIGKDIQGNIEADYGKRHFRYLLNKEVLECFDTMSERKLINAVFADFDGNQISDLEAIKKVPCMFFLDLKYQEISNKKNLAKLVRKIIDKLEENDFKVSGIYTTGTIDLNTYTLTLNSQTVKKPAPEIESYIEMIK